MFETVFPFVSRPGDSTAFDKTDGQEVVTATQWCADRSTFQVLFFFRVENSVSWIPWAERGKFLIDNEGGIL